MANTITALKPDYSRRRKIIRFKVPVTGNYVQVAPNTPAGEILDFTGILNPSFFPNVNFGQIPGIDDLRVVRNAGGYAAEIAQLTPTTPTLANSFALKVFSAPGTELAAGAYPAAITGDYFVIEASVTTWGN